MSPGTPTRDGLHGLLLRPRGVVSELGRRPLLVQARGLFAGPEALCRALVPDLFLRCHESEILSHTICALIQGSRSRRRVNGRSNKEPTPKKSQSGQKTAPPRRARVLSKLGGIPDRPSVSVGCRVSKAIPRATPPATDVRDHGGW